MDWKKYFMLVDKIFFSPKSNGKMLRLFIFKQLAAVYTFFFYGIHVAILAIPVVPCYYAY